VKLSSIKFQKINPVILQSVYMHRK